MNHEIDPGGEIGRHAGLKILWAAMSVRVQVPPGVLTKKRNRMEMRKSFFILVSLFLFRGYRLSHWRFKYKEARSRDSTVVQPLDDDAEFEDACEKSNEKKLKAY